MATELAKAYVQIIPSAEGISGKISNVLNDESEGAGKASGSKFTEGFKSVLGGIGKVTAGALAAGSAAVAGVAKQAVSAYADFEQLSGGIETLFGDTADTAMESAADAFKTAGLSANEYMETVTGFAAALKAGLGDEYAWQMANYAEMAVIDMADNANKMGTSMESIQNAYQGFAKQNFTMLDNLKLGYGGTKEEMQRLLSDAEKLEGLKIGSLDMNNFADVVYAINIIQENMGIAGTTAKEAASTISGSLSMVSGAWQNVIAAMGEGNEDKLGAYINDLVESVGVAANNLLPVVQQTLGGIAQLIQELAPEIAIMLPNLIQQVLPGLLTAGVDIISALGEGILNAIPKLMPVITDVILQLCDMLIQMLPQLIDVGMQVILQLAMGIAQALPELIPALVDTILAIAEYLIDNVDLLIDAAIAIIMGLAEGIINALPKLIEKAPEIIIKLVDALIRNAPKILQAGLELILMLVKGIVDAFGKLLEVGKQIVEKVKGGFDQKVQDAKNWGKDMIQNFIDGIMAKWNDLKASVSKVAQTVKDFIGFSEPKYGALSNFHTFAPDMMQLFAQGINDNIDLVTDAMHNVADDVMSTNIDMNAVQTVGGSIDVQNNSDSIIARIEALLAQYLPYINDNNIYLDTGVLVGATAGSMNTAIGVIGTRSNKR